MLKLLEKMDSVMIQFRFEVENPLAAKAYFIQLMIEEGILATSLFYAMYAHTEDHVKSYLDAADRAFSAIREALEKGELEQRLTGEPTAAGFKRIS